MVFGLGKATFAELAELVLTRIGSAPALGERELSIEKDITRDGITVVRGFLDQPTISLLRKELERVLESRKEKLWRDASGSDRRCYGADRFSAAIREHLENQFIQGIGKHYTRTAMAGRLTLGAKLDYVAGNIGSGGGWHRDSPIRRQFKSLVYLSDVGKDNGPFEYVVGSHRKASVLRLISSKLQRYRQYRYTDDEMSQILERSGLRKLTCTGRAGDLILVDTKGLHRGAPLLSGERYALTNYYWKDRIPEHIASSMN